MTPEVSIVMTAYRRAFQLRNTLHSIAKQNHQSLEVIVVEDGQDETGETRRVCTEEFPWVRYFQRKNRPAVPYSNCAVPTNIGIRAAQGEVVILQNAECRHASHLAIKRLAELHRACDRMAVFASVAILNADGVFERWGNHPDYGSTSPYFFCGSIRREWLVELRGLDEDFIGWGAEDDDLAARLRASGIWFAYRPDVIVEHQWHEVERYGFDANHALFERKKAEMLSGTLSPIRNRGKEWGSPDS